jgi:hypothetical protein
VRPATFAIADTGQAQTGEIQFAPGASSSFTTLAKVTLASKTSCYFDLRLKFPASGTVRVAWRYPALDPSLGDYSADRARAVFSRTVRVTVK